MTLARALALFRTVGWTATPSTRRWFAAALLFAPLLASAQHTDTAPAPAAQETADTPRRPGETTTGRPPAPAVPAPATTPASKAPPTAPLPGDVAASTAPVASAPVSPVATAPASPATASMSPAPRVALPASTPSAAGPGAGGLLQTILALMLVLGLLAGLAWVMKRFGPRMSGGSANLRVVGALNLGGRERIMVVEVGDQWIVVGAAPGRVNALHTMPRQEGEFNPSAVHGASPTGPTTNFSDWLKKTIDKRNAR